MLVNGWKETSWPPTQMELELEAEGHFQARVTSDLSFLS